MSNITNDEILDMLKAILERTERLDYKVDKLDIIESRLAEIKEHTIKTDVKLEHDIGPKLQLLLENQELSFQNAKEIEKLQAEQRDLKDRVDAFGYAIQEIHKKMA